MGKRYGWVGPVVIWANLEGELVLILETGQGLLLSENDEESFLLLVEE